MASLADILDPTTLLVLFAVFLVVKLLLPQKSKLPPGPRPIPIIGNYGYFSDSDKQLEIGRDSRKKYGPVFTIYIGQKPVVLLSSIDAIQEAFVKSGSKLSDRPHDLFTVKLSHPNDIYGVGWANGDIWTRLRRLSLHSMKDAGAVRAKLEESLQTEVTFMVREMESTGGGAFNPRGIIGKAVGNIISTIIFGARFDYEDPIYTQLLCLIDKAFNTKIRIDAFGTLNYIPFLHPIFRLLRLFSKSLKEIAHFRHIFSTHVSGIIDEHRASFDENNLRDIIDLYVAKTREDKQDTLICEKNILRTIFDLYFAGTETSANTLTWALLYMIEHPDIQERCSLEITETIGSQRTVRLSDMDSLPYVQATISEVMRMSPVALTSLPHRASDDVDVGGFTIPRDTLVLADILCCHRSADYWTDPDSFDPEHFLHNGKYKQNKAFVAFSAGPRMCLGESMARAELFMFFTTMLQRFKFTKVNQSDVLNFKGRVAVAYKPLEYELRCVPRNDM